MMKAPERIWAFSAPEIAEDNDGATIVAHDTLQYGAQLYIRADLVGAMVPGVEERQRNDRKR